MLAYALARLYWRFGRPRVYLVVVVYAADPLAPWRRAVEGIGRKDQRIMSLDATLLTYLRESGPAPRAALECHAAEHGYAPVSVGGSLARLRTAGHVRGERCNGRSFYRAATPDLRQTMFDARCVSRRAIDWWRTLTAAERAAVIQEAWRNG